MNELVFMVDGELRTSSEIIAKGTLNEHASVIRIVRKYEFCLCEFGRIDYVKKKVKTNGGGQTRIIALLNERQAAFLITLMRNNDIVITFKMNLIKAFYNMELSYHSIAYNTTIDSVIKFTVNADIDDLPIGCGIVYAIEYGDKIKIGHSTNPKRRIASVKHLAEKYSNVASCNYAISNTITNYREIEVKLHNYYSDIRVSGTELFNISLEKFIDTIPSLQGSYSNHSIVEDVNSVTKNIQKFITERN